jgi:rSAM/selenodomain-associated transferase 2
VRVSIVIPTLNEESTIGATLDAIANLRGSLEVIVADGGSTDRTVEIASSRARVIQGGRGRGRQQAAGACASTGDVLWFLHADTLPAPSAIEAMHAALADPRIGGGNFTISFDGGGRSASRLTAIYPWLRLLGLCYGDSGIFVRREVYDRIGGFHDHPLFEDVDLVRRIRKASRFVTLPETVVTSSRRFEHRNFGAMFTVWTALQVLYWAGVPPAQLARVYGPIRRRGSRGTATPTA